MHKAGHSKAVFRLIVQNAVAAGDQRTGFIHFVVAAAQQLMHCLFGHGFGNGHNVQRQLGLAAHGVNIRKRVGGGNGSKGVGVIGNRGKKVHRLHQRQIIGNFIHAGIIAFVKSHQQIGVCVHTNALQQLCQNPGANLGTAAGTAGQLGKLNVLFHELFLL